MNGSTSAMHDVLVAGSVVRTSIRAVIHTAAAVLGIIAVLIFPRVTHAGAPVEIITNPDGPAIEVDAAEALSEQFRRLFDADVTIDGPRNERAHLILLGNPVSHPQVKKLGLTWPKLSDQGHVIKTVKLGNRTALVVGGGSGAATLWAVYELGQQFGVRYLLSGDLYPVNRPELKLDGFDVVLEPALKLRTWRTINGFAIGPESWGLEEQKRVLRQLAKLKYNRVMLTFYPWQPFVDFEFDGVRKQQATLWYGWNYRVDGDTAGRAAFGGARVFENPDFAGKSSYVDRLAAGRALARGIIDEAHALGMTAAIAFSPLEFPKEFAAVLPDAKPIAEPEKLSIGPGKSQGPDDKRLLALATAQLRAYLDTYPAIDALYMTLPEFPDWGENYEASWKRLDAKTGISKAVSLKELISTARNRSLIASGDRGERALKGNIAALDFFHTLLAQRNILKVADGRTVEPVLIEVDSAFYPYLDKVLPKGTSTLNFVDYTARRVAENRKLLSSLPAAKIPSSLILTLADDNVGVLPQMSLEALHTLVGDLRSLGWDGFSSRYWIVGDLDLPAYYLSRASFDAKITPRQACLDLIAPVCGDGVAEAVWKSIEMVEQATTLIDKSDISFGFPVPGVVMKHYSGGDPPPAWWKEAQDLYLNAMNEMYRANTRARETEGGRTLTLYFARRLEFAYEYFNVVDAVRNAGIAKQAGDAEKQRAELERAVESLHAGLGAMAAVARNNSDRGIIAVLNEYGYRPLKQELERLEAVE